MGERLFCNPRQALIPVTPVYQDQHPTDIHSEQRQILKNIAVKPVPGFFQTVINFGGLACRMDYFA